MSIKKQLLKSKPVCKVSFKLSKDQVAGAAKANLVGSFNNWDVEATPMNALKDGSFSLTLDLETGKNYEFRYLLDGKVWINDEAADSYQESGFGDAQNSVIIL